MISVSPFISLNNEVILPQLVRILSFAGLSFVLAMLVTPVFTYFAYKFQWWKQVKDTAWIGGGKEKAPVFHKLHAAKHKRKIPTMAGIIIWSVVAIITIFFNLDRSQTWLPLFTLISIGILGLFDDYINIRSDGGIAGLKAKVKFSWLLLFAGAGAWWFYAKLGTNFIHVPGMGDYTIGWLYIPLFILVVVSTASAVNITDGLDGLSGGLLSAAFGAYAIIAFFQGNFGLAIFCGTVVGAVLAYTWFNIYPARFFMGDTGAVSLGATLGVVAMLTNTALVLPVIGIVFVIETMSDIIQLFSKKFFGRKVFLSAPIHHHFEAKGWPETKVTMRFWIIGAIAAFMGVVLALVGRGM
ncbi:MAG: phospho-N-acetylmuramoyl-pentapeptide-transferase [bacterium]